MAPRAWGPRRVIGLAAAIALAAAHPSGSNDRLVARSMEPVLLGFGSEELVFESDWVTGCRPAPETLTALEDLARTVHGRPVRHLEGNEIAAALWEESALSVRTLVEKSVSLEPPSAFRVHLLWVPTLRMPGNPFGAARWWMVETRGGPMVIASLLLSRDAIRSARIPGLDVREVERATVLHEYGHLLGLVADRAHAQRDDPYHCRRGACLMPGPTKKMMARGAFRAMFAGKLPGHFCDDCWSDIRRAKGYYASGAGARADLEQRARWQRHLLTGRLHASRGSWAEAEADLRAAVALAVSAQELEDAASAALHHRFPGLVLTAADRAQEAGLGSAVLERVHGRALLALGRFREATGSRDLLTRVRALEGLGQFEVAARAAEAGGAVDQRILAASLLRRSGRPLAALDALRSLPPSTGANPEVILERARCLQALGRPAEARSAFRSAAAEAKRRAERAPDRRSRAERQRTRAIASAHLGEARGAEEAVRSLRELGWPEIALTTQSQVQAILRDTEASASTLDFMRRQGDWPIVDPCTHEDWTVVRERRALPFCSPVG